MYSPPKGVRTPLAELTEVRENEPVTGNDDANEPIMLLIPMAIISWLASTLLPLAVGNLKHSQIKLQYLKFLIEYCALHYQMIWRLLSIREWPLVEWCRERIQDFCISLQTYKSCHRSGRKTLAPWTGEIHWEFCLSEIPAKYFRFNLVFVFISQ